MTGYSERDYPITRSKEIVDREVREVVVRDSNEEFKRALKDPEVREAIKEIFREVPAAPPKKTFFSGKQVKDQK